ncbi:hypothetical protein VaNZ11_002011, partial [Volvox africanus]
MDPTAISEDIYAIAAGLVWTLSLSLNGFKLWTSRASSKSSWTTDGGNATVSTVGQTTARPHSPSDDIYGEIYRRRSPGPSGPSISAPGLKALLVCVDSSRSKAFEALCATEDGNSPTAAKTPAEHWASSLPIGVVGTNANYVDVGRGNAQGAPETAIDGDKAPGTAADWPTNTADHADGVDVMTASAAAVLAAVSGSSNRLNSNKDVDVDADTAAITFTPSSATDSASSGSSGSSGTDDDALAAQHLHVIRGHLVKSPGSGDMWLPLGGQIAPGVPGTICSPSAAAPAAPADPGTAALVAAAAFTLAAAVAQNRSFGGAVASVSPPAVHGFDTCRVRCNVSFVAREGEDGGMGVEGCMPECSQCEDDDEETSEEGDEEEEEEGQGGEASDVSTGGVSVVLSASQPQFRSHSLCEGIYTLRSLSLSPSAASPGTPRRFQSSNPTSERVGGGGSNGGGEEVVGPVLEPGPEQEDEVSERRLPAFSPSSPCGSLMCGEQFLLPTGATSTSAYPSDRSHVELPSQGTHGLPCIAKVAGTGESASRCGGGNCADQPDCRSNSNSSSSMDQLLGGVFGGEAVASAVAATISSSGSAGGGSDGDWPGCGNCSGSISSGSNSNTSEGGSEGDRLSVRSCCGSAEHDTLSLQLDSSEGGSLISTGGSCVQACDVAVDVGKEDLPAEHYSRGDAVSLTLAKEANSSEEAEGA